MTQGVPPQDAREASNTKCGEGVCGEGVWKKYDACAHAVCSVTVTLVG